MDGAAGREQEIKVFRKLEDKETHAIRTSQLFTLKTVVFIGK